MERDNIFMTIIKDFYVTGTDAFEVFPAEGPIDVGNFSTAIIYAAGKSLSSPAPEVMVETSMDQFQAAWPTGVAAFAVTTAGETNKILPTNTVPLYRWLRVKVGKTSGSYAGRVTVTLLLKR